MLDLRGGERGAVGDGGNFTQLIKCRSISSWAAPTVLLMSSSCPPSVSGDSSPGNAADGFRLGLCCSAAGLRHHVLGGGRHAVGNARWSVHLLGGAASEEKLNLDAGAAAGFSGGSDFDAAADEDADAEVDEALDDDRDEIRRSSSDWPGAADDAGIARLGQQCEGMMRVIVTEEQRTWTPAPPLAR